MNDNNRSYRILYCNICYYLDNSSGAAIASRCMMEKLNHLGFSVEAYTGDRTEMDTHRLAPRRPTYHADLGNAAGKPFYEEAAPTDMSLICETSMIDGIPLTVYRGPTTSAMRKESPEFHHFLAILDSVLLRFQPQVLINFGGDVLSNAIRLRAKSRGIAVIFPIHNFGYRHGGAFASADATIVPSIFAADYYRRSLSIEPIVLPNAISSARALIDARDPKYLTFVNPSYEKGVFAFARIADDLGKRRPDIPLLVVESRGNEATVAACGIDLVRHATVFFMGHTDDPRRFWQFTRLCLLPSVCWENQPLVAIEAMLNGIPVVASDRGGIPETLGNSGILLSLPEWLTPKTRILPTSREVAHWVDSIIGLWDDTQLYNDHCQRSLVEANRWSSDSIDEIYQEVFRRFASKLNIRIEF